MEEGGAALGLVKTLLTYWRRRRVIVGGENLHGWTKRIDFSPRTKLGVLVYRLTGVPKSFSTSAGSDPSRLWYVMGVGGFLFRVFAWFSCSQSSLRDGHRGFRMDTFGAIKTKAWCRRQSSLVGCTALAPAQDRIRLPIKRM